MHKWFLAAGRQAIWVAMLAVAATVVSARAATGYTPESPKVKQTVARAVRFLESDDAKDGRVGARALVGLVLVKTGARRDHPKILEAVEAIQKVVKGHDPAKIMLGDKVIYHVGLAVMFLVAHDPIGHRADIECLLKYLQLVQKDHGGWGYPNSKEGDTSMTQYGVLSYWEATQAGFHIPPDSIEAVATWLLRTQDPNGGFGYQGILSPNFTPVKQDSTPLSLGAAGLGSVYICADMLGLIAKAEEPSTSGNGDDLPPALQEVKKDKPAEGAAGAGTRLDPRLFAAVQSRGLAWLGKNYRIDPGRYTHYYLYALERCMSFRELAEGKAGRKKAAEGPFWYNDGVEFLAETQKEDGCWKGECGAVPDTAFAVLFLIRSTQKSIAKSRNFGDGTLIGGRGLPKETGRCN